MAADELFISSGIWGEARKADGERAVQFCSGKDVETGVSYNPVSSLVCRGHKPTKTSALQKVFITLV